MFVKLAEGKTKIIWEVEGSSEDVLIESKNDITAGDGERRDLLIGKALYSTQTTANCFSLLTRKGIPNHFLGLVYGPIFRARNVSMIPIEVVIRRIAFGSYLRRHPSVLAESRFETPVVELFHKDDANHDPLLVLDVASNAILRFDPRQPLSVDPIGRIPLLTATELQLQHWPEMVRLGTRVFEILEQAWQEQRVTLVDLKVEFGLTRGGELLLADVIDNDSWRIWPEGDPTQMKDKQVFRDNSASLEDIAKNYQWVAAATDKFLS